MMEQIISGYYTSKFSFEMQLVNGALFLKANFLSYASLSGFVTVIFPLTTVYASL